MSRHGRRCLVAVAAAWLWPRCCDALEGWDVAATIYRDQFCFERAEDVLLLSGACYSTMSFSNTSEAFTVKVVSFGHKGSEWVVDYQEFSDECHTPVTAPSSLTVGKCVGFLGRFRGQLDVKLRSDRCSGDGCSNLAIAEQNFFAADNCQGPPLVEFRRRVPLQGECLASYNGSSQHFVLMPTDGDSTTRITKTVYQGDTKCSALSSVEYNVLGKCYALYEDSSPRSFSWSAHRKVLSLTSACRRARASIAVVAITLAAAVFRGARPR